MPLGLPSFGPQLPSGNSQQVLSKLQTVGLPNPTSLEIQKALSTNSLTGTDVKTIFTSQDASQLLAGRAAPQNGQPLSANEIKMQQDIAVGKAAPTFGSPVGDTASDVPSSSILNLQSLPQTLKPPAYYKVRIPWELTTVRRLAIGEPPILFYVNPDSVRYNLQLTQSLDQVQRGFFLTVWKDYDGNPNFFPCMKFNFKFQSSNILPESYSSSNRTLINTAKTKSDFAKAQSQIDQIAQQAAAKIKDGSYVYDGSFESQYGGNIPPGLLNFYNILDLFNEDRIINITDEAMWDYDGVEDTIESLKPYNGEPNYVLLKISTRIFPKMWLMGFFENGLQWDEQAQNPLEFTSDLSFVAFKSDPLWWDTEKIQSSYSEFWSDYFQGSLILSPDVVKAEEVRIDQLESLDEIPYTPRDFSDIDLTGPATATLPTAGEMAGSTPIATPPLDAALAGRIEFLGLGTAKCSVSAADLAMAKQQVAAGEDANYTSLAVTREGQAAPAYVSYAFLRSQYGL